MESQDMTAEAGVAWDEQSQPYEGRWNRLISTTNWEKGEIVLEWRSALESSKAASTEYSDESWAQRVGGVTGQHVGRLRRVYERFGETHGQYTNLFWSHFQATVDWDDAEMWLEGAVQNRWSVAKMRKGRWEALGAPEGLKPKDEDIVSMEINEDLDTREDQSPEISEAEIASFDEARSPAGPDFGDEDDSSGGGTGTAMGPEDAQTSVPFARPFENIGELPDDIGEAFESFKLAIIRHKANGWEDFPQEDLLGTLEALRELALSPAAAS